MKLTKDGINAFLAFAVISLMLISSWPSTSGTSGDHSISITGYISTWIAGVFFTSWGTNAYSEPKTTESLQLLKEQANPSWLSIPIVWEMPNRTSNLVERSNATVSDERLIQVIQKIKLLGLKIKLHLLCDPQDGVWRAQIEPSNWTEWFDNYRKFVNYYARIAEEYGVQMISIGAELRSTVTHENEWRDTINQTRGIYHGLLTYGANHDSSYKPGEREWDLVKWWDALDYAGIDGYFELTNKTSPTIDELVAGWEKYRGEIQAWQAIHGKPVIMDEIGYKSEEGGSIGLMYKSGIYSSEEQSNCMEAFFRVFRHEEWVAGVFCWGWSYDPNSGGAGDLTILLNNKPAVQILKNWFS